MCCSGWIYIHCVSDINHGGKVYLTNVLINVKMGSHLYFMIYHVGYDYFLCSQRQLAEDRNVAVFLLNITCYSHTFCIFYFSVN